ncbi:hypothetical protein JB92DRAFT_2997347 [Gautieria morchelliformis]|nr:hypothetical protein JB92DRAFT_2997347 [Gautieria morchelliformis]
MDPLTNPVSKIPCTCKYARTFLNRNLQQGSQTHHLRRPFGRSSDSKLTWSRTSNRAL